MLILYENTNKMLIFIFVVYSYIGIIKQQMFQFYYSAS